MCTGKKLVFDNVSNSVIIKPITPIVVVIVISISFTFSYEYLKMCIWHASFGKKRKLKKKKMQQLHLADFHEKLHNYKTRKLLKIIDSWIH